MHCVTLMFVEPVYLTAGMPRWTPLNETDLSEAAQQGVLEETHYLDVKREISAGRGANKELALPVVVGAVTPSSRVVRPAEEMAPRQDGVRTQNSLPSGSARHVHGTSPWPKSMSVAPRARSRAASAS